MALFSSTRQCLLVKKLPLDLESFSENTKTLQVLLVAPLVALQGAPERLTGWQGGPGEAVLVAWGPAAAWIAKAFLEVG